MKKILIFTARYLPGYKDGGPLRTVKNVTDSLSQDYDFTVACYDRDLGDTKAYENIKINDINKVDNISVYYAANEKFSFSQILSLSKNADLVYVCGPYYDFSMKIMILKRLGLIKIPVVLAPMGSFSKGALSIKSTKKKVFFKVFDTLKLFDKLSFSVTSKVEEEELKDVLKIKGKCFVAEDMPRKMSADNKKAFAKEEGVLKVLFLSRICVKKNLLYAAEVMKNIASECIFHIYGIMEDAEYYASCEDVLTNLPSNVSWEYKGGVDSEDVPKIFSQYDVFLFPTLGENFGHVISEAMSAGCIPVLSDTTPWLDLEEKSCGYVISLDNKDRFVNVVDSLCKMTSAEILNISNKASEYAYNKYLNSVNNSGYKEMFNELL